jgi:alpha-amylase
MGDAARPFAVLCATWTAVPLIYSGQELPMINKRLHFFDKDMIPWAGENALHIFYKKLLALHSTHPALRAGDKDVRTFRIETTHNEQVFAYLHKKEEREVLVILNLSANKLRVEIKGKVVAGDYKNIFSGAGNDLTAHKTFELEGWDYLVFEK